MVKEKYLKEIKKIINRHNYKNARFFIFGSSLRKEYFGDLDIGVTGKIKREEIIKLKEEFEDSNLPYFIDVIDFNKVSNKFKDNIFNNKISWIKH